MLPPNVAHVHFQQSRTLQEGSLNEPERTHRILIGHTGSRHSVSIPVAFVQEKGLETIQRIHTQFFGQRRLTLNGTGNAYFVDLTDELPERIHQFADALENA